MIGTGGVVASILVFAAGAIVDFAVTASTAQHGFDVRTVGVILMVVGAVGFAVSMIFFAVSNTGHRRHETTVDDGYGHVMHREDRVS
jgi:hypothetical protein